MGASQDVLPGGELFVSQMVLKSRYRFMNQSKAFLSWMKKHYFISGVFILIIVSIYAIMFVSAPEINKEEASKRSAAQTELSSFIQTAEQAKIISSYDFTNDRVVYVDSAWYKMSVQEKKDFLTHVGALKKAATGFQNFEARDSHTNEKVGEITSFNQSVEVYK